MRPLRQLFEEDRELGVFWAIRRLLYYVRVRLRHGPFILFWPSHRKAMVRLRENFEFAAAMEEAETQGSTLVCMDLELDINGVWRHDSRGVRFKAPPEMEGPVLESVLAIDAGPSEGRRERLRECLHIYKEAAPDDYQVLFADRDEAMMRHLVTAQGRAVAVVGQLHLPGLEDLWKEWMAKGPQHWGVGGGHLMPPPPGSPPQLVPDLNHKTPETGHVLYVQGRPGEDPKKRALPRWLQDPAIRRPRRKKGEDKSPIVSWGSDRLRNTI